MEAPDAESVSWLRFIFASATVIGLMAALGWGLKYFSMRGWLKVKQPVGRIGVTASFPIDARRRVIIVKCDESEYHLLLSPNNDIVLSQHSARPPDSRPSGSCS